MPYRGSFGVIMALHVLTAVFVVGPLGVATLAAPRLLRAARRAAAGGAGGAAGGGGGALSMAGLRMAVWSIRGFTLASVLVVAFGFALVNQGAFGSVRGVGDPWILASIIVWVLAAVVNAVVLDAGLRRALGVLEGGGDAARLVPVVEAAAVLSAACWATIVVLMVVKPGA
jgi:hypothetical protein